MLHAYDAEFPTDAILAAKRRCWDALANCPPRAAALQLARCALGRSRHLILETQAVTKQRGAMIHKPAATAALSSWANWPS